MSQASMDGDYAGPASLSPQLDRKPVVAGVLIFFAVLLAALGLTAASVLGHSSKVGETNLATGTFVLLGLALLIALGFEFVSGFHNTANAVATVIYTHSMPPMVAVVWSGAFNFLGVLTSTGAVAYSIVVALGLRWGTLKAMALAWVITFFRYGDRRLPLHRSTPGFLRRPPGYAGRRCRRGCCVA